MIRCSFCSRDYDFEHKPTGKYFCNRCWERFCKNNDKKYENQMLKESGTGLYKWVK